MVHEGTLIKRQAYKRQEIMQQRITNKKNYQRPAMIIIQVQQSRLLMTSGTGANRESYGTAEESTWE